jgi:hypothetical protein
MIKKKKKKKKKRKLNITSSAQQHEAQVLNFNIYSMNIYI